MSFEAAAWAIKTRPSSKTAKLILIILADHHNRDNQRCDPSIKGLAEESMSSESTARRALRSLEEEGFLTSVERSGKRTQYNLNIGFGVEKKTTPIKMTPQSKLPETPVTGDTPPLSLVTPEPVSNQEEEPVSADPTLITEEDIAKAWLYFWEQMPTGCTDITGKPKTGFPKKQNKTQAQARFTKMAKGLKKKDKLVQLVQKIQKNCSDRFRAGEWRSDGINYIPNADRYLNRELYEDEVCFTRN